MLGGVGKVEVVHKAVSIEQNSILKERKDVKRSNKHVSPEIVEHENSVPVVRGMDIIRKSKHISKIVTKMGKVVDFAVRETVAMEIVSVDIFLMFRIYDCKDSTITDLHRM